MLRSVKNGSQISVDHAKTAIYNALCALNLIHSANLSLRNLTSNCMKIDEKCQVKLHDLNQVRSLPPNYEDSSLIYQMR